MIRRSLLAAGALTATALACGSEPPPRPPRPVAAVARPARPAARPAPPPDRSADVARDLGVDVASLVFSPSRSAFAVALPPKTTGGAEGEAPHRLLVYGIGGDQRAAVPALRAGSITELRFLGEDRLVYRPPPVPAPPPRRRRGAVKVKPPAPGPAYLIQPISAPRAPLIACEGRGFVFSPAGDHLAFVVGEPGHEHVGVDGVQVYPRAGETSILGEPAWSRDGGSLALIEGGGRPQLVVLVEFDNPNGDNTWPLPPQATDPSLHVFWAGRTNVVIGRELTKPVFATSFTRE